MPKANTPFQWEPICEEKELKRRLKFVSKKLARIPNVEVDLASPEFQFVEKRAWLGGLGTYHMGVDGISMLFVILTTFLMPLCILASWEAIETRVAEYMVAFLVLESLMIGVFCALDAFLDGGRFSRLQFNCGPEFCHDGATTVPESAQSRGFLLGISGQR